MDDYGSFDYSTTMEMDPGTAGAVAAFSMVFLLFILAVVIFLMISQYILAKKLNDENPWMAFIPILNVYQLVILAQKPGWWLIWFFIPLANLIASILVYDGLSQRTGHGVGMTLALIFVFPVALPILAFTYQPKQNVAMGGAHIEQ